MSVMDDLRESVISYQARTGLFPAWLSIGRTTAEALAAELWENRALITGSEFTTKNALDSLVAGEMRFMDIPVTVEATFPTPEQVAAIEGYRLVGPC